jgi:hypothetical protein
VGSNSAILAVARPTPNEFLAGRTPTFIVGTTGDDRADRAIAAQARLVRDSVFPQSAIVADTDLPAAADAWPAVAVVYGGPHVNAVMARLAPCLPFQLGAGHLALGGASYDRDDLAIVTVLPARAASGSCPGHPELLLYAGTGTPGIEEINAGTVTRGGEPLVIGDGLGRLRGGRWEAGAAVLEPEVARPAWTHVVREVGGVKVDAAFLGEPPEAAIAACERAITAALTRLELRGDGLTMTIYLHADREAKRAATGNAGDGHAVPFARALHVIAGNTPAALLSLVTHEATHVLLPQTWGPAGSAMMGEGVAVWTSGKYQGRTLADWRASLGANRPSIADLLGKFRAFPEPTTYPASALVVETIVATVGLAGLRDHLYGAPASTWGDAVTAAGTTLDALSR